LDERGFRLVKQHAVLAGKGRIARVNTELRQAGAIFESPAADIGHTGGNGHVRQVAAAVEGQGADGPQAVSQGDVRGCCAAAEHITAKCNHAVGDDDACQPAAAAEGIAANGGHVVAQGEGPQTQAPAESVITDGDDTVRDLQAGQGAAAVEGVMADVRDAGRDGDGRQACAAVEGVGVNGRHPERDGEIAFPTAGILDQDRPIVIVQHSGLAGICQIPRLHIQGDQRGTGVKSPRADVGDPGGNGEALQHVAALARKTANPAEVAPELQVHQRCAPAERIIANRDDAIGKRDAGQSRAALERAVLYGRDPAADLDVDHSRTIQKRVSSNR